MSDKLFCPDCINTPSQHPIWTPCTLEPDMSLTDDDCNPSTAYLERAMAQSRDEAEAWDKSSLARFALMQCNALELASDELAGISPLADEDRGHSEIESALNEALNTLRTGLEMLRENAVNGATAGYGDEDFEELIERGAPTVSEALAKMRKEMAK